MNAGDLEAALEIFAPDAVVMPPGQPVLAGPSLRAWMSAVLGNFTLEVENIVALRLMRLLRRLNSRKRGVDLLQDRRWRLCGFLSIAGSRPRLLQFFQLGQRNLQLRDVVGKHF